MRTFFWHVRRGTFSYALGGILPAHISVFLPTCVQGILTLHYERHCVSAYVMPLSFWATAKNLEDTFHIHYRISDPSLRLRLRTRWQGECTGWQKRSSVHKDKVRTRKLWHPPCTHLLDGTADYEHSAQARYWHTTRYKIPLFVVLQINSGVRTKAICNTLITNKIKRYHVRTPTFTNSPLAAMWEGFLYMEVKISIAPLSMLQGKSKTIPRDYMGGSDKILH